MALLTTKIKKAGYEPGKSVIENINFSVHAGELVGLIGDRKSVVEGKSV